MSTTALRLAEVPAAETASPDRLKALKGDVEAGRLIPYLGPGVLACGPKPAVPVTTVELAMALHQRVPVGARLRGNMWGTAQFIEQRRHRKSLVAFMADIFKAPVESGALQRWLATLQIPLIVDTWYDAGLAGAFAAAGRTDFAEIQGVTRALENRDVWVKAYKPDGTEIPLEVAEMAATLIYKPHGSAKPASNFLVADSDYVEVLTEIDIQTPIPDVIKQRRSGRGFLFLGCRFDDQMLRTYARQILKRSGGPHAVVVDFEPTRMELRFFEELQIEVVPVSLADAITLLAGA